MQNVFLALIISFFATVISTPLTIKLAKRYGLLDDPTTRPHPAHIQKRIIPRAGGLPVFIGIIIGIIFFIPADKHILGIILGLTILLITGLIDDAKANFKPLPRLLIQITVAAIVVASGVGITFVTNPFGGILRLDGIVIPINLFGPHNIVLIADIFALFWIVWMMNILNWSKGVDGQMPGITLVASITVGLLSLKLSEQGDINQLYISILSFIVSGAAFGALLFNWYPSKILQGFSGSTIFGFMIATLSILSGAKLATALLVMLIPTVDFFYTFSRRVISKQNPMKGDQKHLHHLLLKRGWSHQKISLFYILSCAILGLLATSLSSQGKWFVFLGVGAVVVGILLWLHLFSEQHLKA